MSQTQGSKVRVRWIEQQDRLNPERTGKNLAELTKLVGEVTKLWLDAMEAGVYQRRGDGTFRAPTSSSDPTSQAALSPTQRQVRRKAERAAVLIEQAVERLDEAGNVLHKGLLLTDEEAWEEHNEKRQAATQGG